MKTIDYDTVHDQSIGNTATHMAVDEAMLDKNMQTPRVYEEGFASASGVRPETAESGGRIRHPENKDDAIVEERVVDLIEMENAGLADA